MARGGIYKSEVQRARANLIAQGRYPSVDAIRIELGNTGSKSTIQRYLKEITEDEGARGGGLPALSEAIQALARQLAERLQAEADERIAQLQAKHADELRAARETASALQDQLHVATRELDEARREIADGEERYEDLAAQYTAEAKARTQAAQQVADLQIQLQAQTAHTESLEGKYADARRSLEHFRDAAKEQREREARKHESEVQFLHQEVRSLQTALTETQSKFATTSEDRARLQTELDAARRGLEAAERTKVELAATTDRLAGAMVDREGLSKLLEAERRRSEALAAEGQSIAGDRQRLEARVRELESELLVANARQEATERLQAQIDEQIRVQFGQLLQRTGKKSARA
jgi:chromosome segregation ATPase